MHQRAHLCGRFTSGTMHAPSSLLPLNGQKRVCLQRQHCLADCLFLRFDVRTVALHGITSAAYLQALAESSRQVPGNRALPRSVSALCAAGVSQARASERSCSCSALAARGGRIRRPSGPNSGARSHLGPVQHRHRPSWSAAGPHQVHRREGGLVRAKVARLICPKARSPSPSSASASFQPAHSHHAFAP